MADITKLYFDEIKDDRGLSKEETRRVALLAQKGDEKAILLLTKNHLLLVAKYARKYSGMGVEFQDLLAEGNVGLLTAIGKWRANGGASFTTVATWWIKQSIIRNCMHNNRIVRLPEHISELMRTSRIPYTYSETHIDKQNDNGSCLSDTLAAEEKDIFASEEEMLKKKEVEKILVCLKPKEKRVIEMYFGLNEGEIFDTKQISEQLELTTTRINQILKSSLQKMREYGIKL